MGGWGLSPSQGSTSTGRVRSYIQAPNVIQTSDSIVQVAEGILCVRVHGSHCDQGVITLCM